MSIQAPLPEMEKEKLERKVDYEQLKKDITKWEPLVKRNREAVSIEDVRDQQNYLAKMRSHLFHHEMKAKHIKNIRSKTYSRILKKKRQKQHQLGSMWILKNLKSSLLSSSSNEMR
ncbi:hypothetical protein KSP39_PZI009620 [Platanthera zijinensis]|uniref:Uncharacterized protein n=1 Tax=Platanthera zijinensis TaxID=2320716 RepID=A0AAP0G810_9ASPA